MNGWQGGTGYGEARFSALFPLMSVNAKLWRATHELLAVGARVDIAVIAACGSHCPFSAAGPVQTEREILQCCAGKEIRLALRLTVQQ